jgi:hypothetical protein
MIRLLLLLLLLLPAPLLALDQAGPEALDYPSRWGIVTFKHFAHQKRVGNCRTCHHPGVEMGVCAGCHGTILGLAQRKDVLHKQCTGCHWQQQGPTECSGCHDPERLDEEVYRD